MLLVQNSVNCTADSTFIHALSFACMPNAIFVSDVAEVVYTVVYSASSPADVELSPLNGVVVFAPAQTQANITVTVLDDEQPELEEMLSLTLVSVSGDAVLVSPSLATLVIELSDDPNGVFAFTEDSLLVERQEGETAQLT